MSDEGLNKLDFETTAIKQDNEFVSLKELGATLVNKIVKSSGVRFLIHLSNNSTISTNEIYNVFYLENDLKFKEIDEKDKFYKRVDVRV